MNLLGILRPIVFHFAGGDSLFTGSLLLIGAAVWSAVDLRRASPPRLATLRRAIGGLGVLFILLSATPLFWPIAVGWLAAGWLVSRRATVLRTGLFTVVTVGIAALEAVAVLQPLPPISSGTTIAVLGDSLSAAESPRRPNWPERFEELADGQNGVTNLAHPGATAADAVRQARGIPPEAGAVIVFIGGNDLLAGTRAAEYERGLDEVLALAAAPGRQLYLVELPLIPFHGSYGRAQRRLARKHRAALISKRVVAGVLSRADSTTDGLHLSEAGSRWLAEEFSRRLRPK